MPEEPAAHDAGGKPNPWPEPRWLEAHESPFGIRVYDCRKTTQETLVWTTREESAKEWLRLTMANGEEFREAAMPDALMVPCLLPYSTPAEREEGRYVRPGRMEETWCVDFYDGSFHFIQALESRLVYRARVRPAGPESLIITHLEVHPEEAEAGPSHALDAVDYLMKAYLFRWVAPHPFPPRFRDHPEGDLASYSFFKYGRRALFGTFESTRQFMGLPWDPQKVIHYGLPDTTKAELECEK